MRLTKTALALLSGSGLAVCMALHILSFSGPVSHILIPMALLPVFLVVGPAFLGLRNARRKTLWDLMGPRSRRSWGLFLLVMIYVTFNSLYCMWQLPGGALREEGPRFLLYREGRSEEVSRTEYLRFRSLQDRLFFGVGMLFYTAGVIFWTRSDRRPAASYSASKPVDSCQPSDRELNALERDILGGSVPPSGSGSLHRMVIEASAAEVQAVIGQKPDTDTVNRYGNSPLHHAAAHGEPETVRVLLEAGLRPSLRNHAGQTPLHWASVCGRVENVGLLLEAGADVNHADENGQTPLHCVMQEDIGKKERREIIRRLLEAGADPRAKDSRDRPPIYYCLKVGDTRLRKHLDFPGAKRPWLWW